jgi:hypothetical protein
LLTLWLLLKRRGALGSYGGTLGFLATLFWAFFLLYSFVFGSGHLARYIIFTMPALVLLAAVGTKWAWDSWDHADRPLLKHAPALTFAVLALALVGVYSAETSIRIKLDSQSALWRAMQAPNERQAFSDELFDQMGQPEALPIIVGLVEVQARYWLDDRFVVRSLDGRIDSVLLDYADNSGIDHPGYLREREVRFILEIPSFNRDPNRWSLKRLSDLKPGEAVTQDGVTFSRMEIDKSARNQASQAAESQPLGFRSANGVIHLHYFLADLIRVGDPGL